MRRNAIVFALILTLVCTVLAAAQTDPREGPIRDMLKQHFDGMKKENAESVLATIHPQSPVYPRMEEMLPQIFSTYDLSYDWRIVKIEITGDALAYVEIEQTTKKVAGPDFRNNRVTSRSELRKYEGAWKLFSSNIVGEIEYLN